MVPQGEDHDHVRRIQGHRNDLNEEQVEGDACPRCGTPFDPDVDVEGCENCRQLALQESERTAEDVDPDPDELAAVERFKLFLAREPDPALSYCPGCLNEFRADATACVTCVKELLSAEDVSRHARRSVEDLTAQWFVPVTDDTAAEFVETLLAGLEADEKAPEVELRVKRVYRDFSPIFAVWRSYRTQYFARRSQLPRLRRWVADAELDARFEEHRQALLSHLDRLIVP